MTRYVVHREGGWSVVNQHRKKAIKNFEVQKEAIQYASKMESTTSIVVQNHNGRFRRVTSWDLKESPDFAMAKNVPTLFVPRYVRNESSIKYNLMPDMILWSTIIATGLLTIIFTSLFLVNA